MQSFGGYDVDSHGQPCYRPPIPPFPSMDRVWRDYEDARRPIAEFDRRVSQFPRANVIGKLFARHDAVHSAGAEGATTTFTDLMGYQTELRRAPDLEDAQSVFGCAEAFDALSAASSKPTEMALAIHRRLFEKAKNPHVAGGAGLWKIYRNGTFDQDQGGFFYYTAPAVLDRALAEWEAFTMQSDSQPELIRQALSHWMFEHIHPVPDGNGRVGRLLVPLVLRTKGETNTACAFFGEAVHANKGLYVDALKNGRLTGDLTPYIRVFLSLVRQTAEANLDRLDRLDQIDEEWTRKLSGFRKHAGVHAVAEFALTSPIFTVNDVVAGLAGRLSWQSANVATEKLAELGIIQQLGGGHKRSRLFEATDVMGVFEALRTPEARPSCPC